jgi:hypothetical protein
VALIRANSSLPARRRNIVLETSDGLTMFGELALPAQEESVASVGGATHLWVGFADLALDEVVHRVAPEVLVPLPRTWGGPMEWGDATAYADRTVAASRVEQDVDDDGCR